MQLFKIGANYDLTNRITVPSYKVNDNPEYQEFKDANFTLHRRVVREQKLSGDFTVKFYSLGEYSNFLSAINENKLMDGSVYCIAYANNKLATRAAYLYLDFEPVNNLPLFEKEDYEGFTIKVTER